MSFTEIKYSVKYQCVNVFFIIIITINIIIIINFS